MIIFIYLLKMTVHQFFGKNESQVKIIIIFFNYEVSYLYGLFRSKEYFAALNHGEK